MVGIIQKRNRDVTNTWSGNGAKDTENFAVTENTRINWETTNAQGIFQIYVQDKDGTPAAVAANMQGIGKDVSYLHITPGGVNGDIAKISERIFLHKDIKKGSLLK